MGMMNRMGNARNRYQTDVPRVLCLCSAGLLRSPTAANVLHQEYGYNTRAAGVNDDFALVCIDEVLLGWADEIVCVEQEIADRLEQFIEAKYKFQTAMKDKITVLNIPDEFEWNDPQLRKIILEQYKQTSPNGLTQGGVR